jgi:hypothetical protein
MFMPWWVIIAGIIILISIGGSGKATLRRHISELEDQIQELEEKLDEIKGDNHEHSYMETNEEPYVQ